MQNNEKFCLFLDNVHLLPACENAKRDLKFLLKEKKGYKHWFTLVATSSHGLLTLTKNVISKDETVVIVVNPEKHVAEGIMDTCLPEWKDITSIRELVDYLGYVPGSIFDFLARYRFNAPKDVVDKEDLIRPVTTAIKSIIMQDQEYFLKEEPEVFVKILAMLAANKEVVLDKAGLNPLDIPWTLLKSSDSQPIRYVVSAVSKAVADTARDFIFNNTQGIKAYVQALHDLFNGQVGPLSGFILEHVIRKAMLQANELVYYYYSLGNGVQKGTEDFTSLQLDLKSNRSSVIPDELSKETLLHTPCAAKYDLVATDSNGLSHAIQVSKVNWGTKCSKSKFYEETRYNYKYIVTPQIVDASVVSKAMEKSPNLKNAMVKHDLRVLDAYSFADRDLLKLITGLS